MKNQKAQLIERYPRPGDHYINETDMGSIKTPGMAKILLDKKGRRKRWEHWIIKVYGQGKPARCVTRSRSLPPEGASSFEKIAWLIKGKLEAWKIKMGWKRADDNDWDWPIEAFKPDPETGGAPWLFRPWSTGWPERMPTQGDIVNLRHPDGTVLQFEIKKTIQEGHGAVIPEYIAVGNRGEEDSWLMCFSGFSYNEEEDAWWGNDSSSLLDPAINSSVIAPSPSTTANSLPKPPLEEFDFSSAPHSRTPQPLYTPDEE